MRRRAPWAVPVTVMTLVILAGALFAAGGRGRPAPQAAASALELAAGAPELALTRGLAVGLIGSYGRAALPTDLLAWQLAQGTMAEPRVGAVIGKNAKGDELAWAAVEANKDGVIENRALAGGYLFLVVNSETARTMILDATGFYEAWINWELRGGEKYGADYLRHPLRLVKGRNVLLFRGERGRFKGRLYEPPSPISFTDKDMTLPDLVVGEKGPS